MTIKVIDVDKLREILKFDTAGIDEDSSYLMPVSNFMTALRMSEVSDNKNERTYNNREVPVAPN